MDILKRRMNPDEPDSFSKVYDTATDPPTNKKAVVWTEVQKLQTRIQEEGLRDDQKTEDNMRLLQEARELGG